MSTAPKDTLAAPGLSHLPALDGVRGLAILLVIACHTSAHIGSESHLADALSQGLFRSLGAGWIGVDLFFVLSGFLITRILLASRGRPRFCQSFYLRRALRILPLYLAFCGFLAFEYHLRPTPAARADLLSLLGYYNNIREALVGWHTAFALHLWSLAVEEHFYLVWPFLVAFTPTRHLRIVCVAGIALSFFLRVLALTHSVPVHAVYILTPCRLDGLLAGAWLASAFTDPALWPRVQRWRRPVMALAATGLALIAIYQGHLFDFVSPSHRAGMLHSSRVLLGPGLLLLAVFFAALLTESISGGPVSRILQRPVLKTLGTYSYGMYVLHVYVMIRIRGAILHHLTQTSNYLKLEPILFFSVLLGTFAVAYVSYNIYEKPFLTLKRFFPATGDRVARSSSR